MKLIEGDKYLNEIINVVNTPDIKVITGVRRSDKSKLLDVFYDYLNNAKKGNIIRINLNLKKYETLLDKEKLYEYIDNKFVDGVNNYLLIDEIQLCDGFERIINSKNETSRKSI